tara:strand:- start:1425 stop:1619 length:195 start_codon:yes stop_codon:yes gene_type:complete
MNEDIKLSEAIELVLNEAESSALGDEHKDHANKVLNSIECIQLWYDQYGHQFENFSIENNESLV